MTELLPCPFCGGRGMRAPSVSSYEVTEVDGCRIKCVNDGCPIDGKSFYGAGAYEEAVAWWNRRPSPAPVSAPSPAGGVRESWSSQSGGLNADWVAMVLSEDARIEDGKLANASYLAVKIAEAADMPNEASRLRKALGYIRDHTRETTTATMVLGALSSPATPEPVSAPAGEVAEEPRKVTKLNHFGVKNSADMWRTFNGAHYGHWTSEFDAEMVKRYRAAGVRCRVAAGEMFVHHEDTGLAEKVYKAISNPAPGHGEAVPVAWRWRSAPGRDWAFDQDQEAIPDRLMVAGRWVAPEVEALGVIAHPATSEKDRTTPEAPGAQEETL